MYRCTKQSGILQWWSYILFYYVFTYVIFIQNLWFCMKREMSGILRYRSHQKPPEFDQKKFSFFKKPQKIDLFFRPQLAAN